MIPGVPLSMPESAKPRVRAASLELAIRVLRTAQMNSAAGWLKRAKPEAISGGPSSPREVSTVARDPETIARSLRRCSLRYAARKFRAAGVHEDAAVYLERTADEIELQDDPPQGVPGGAYRSSSRPQGKSRRTRR